jgi:8-oxo-dGTP diphosphatase
MTEVTVVCAIIEHEDKVLAAQRSLRMPLPFLWEFPGGKVKEGETEEHSLLREIREELNISVTIHERLTTSSHFDGQKQIHLIPFICSIDEGNPKAIEHEAFLWCDQEKCAELNWCPADIPIVGEYWQLRKKL